MANNLNSITVVGNITRDPEMRFTPSGVSKVTFGVACNRSWRNQTVERMGRSDELLQRRLLARAGRQRRSVAQEGARVVVTGRLEQRSWETEQGEKRSVVEIVADEVGPSLRFATAEVHQVERSGPGGGGGGPSGGGGNAPAPSGGGGANYDDFGEEPF